MNNNLNIRVTHNGTVCNPQQYFFQKTGPPNQRQRDICDRNDERYHVYSLFFPCYFLKKNNIKETLPN